MTSWLPCLELEGGAREYFALVRHSRFSDCSAPEGALRRGSPELHWEGGRAGAGGGGCERVKFVDRGQGVIIKGYQWVITEDDARQVRWFASMIAQSLFKVQSGFQSC
jgi:hypothetical protein